MTSILKALLIALTFVAGTVAGGSSVLAGAGSPALQNPNFPDLSVGGVGSEIPRKHRLGR
jgi:hypothetical protein